MEENNPAGYENVQEMEIRMSCERKENPQDMPR
jgi:uncharacterized Zn-finger protein